METVPFSGLVLVTPPQIHQNDQQQLAHNFKGVRRKEPNDSWCCSLTIWLSTLVGCLEFKTSNPIRWSKNPFIESTHMLGISHKAPSQSTLNAPANPSVAHYYLLQPPVHFLWKQIQNSRELQCATAVIKVLRKRLRLMVPFCVTRGPLMNFVRLGWFITKPYLGKSTPLEFQS